MLSVFTAGDAFIYLALDRWSESRTVRSRFSSSAPRWPTALAIPMGRLADRVGRLRVFVGGYACLLVVYGVLLSDVGGLFAVVCQPSASWHVLRRDGRRTDGNGQLDPAA